VDNEKWQLSALATARSCDPGPVDDGPEVLQSSRVFTTGGNMMKGSVKKRSNGYTIIYDIGMCWNEKKQRHVRKQKWEKVPWKKQKNKATGKEEWVPPNKTDAKDLLAKRFTQLNTGEFVETTDMTFADFKDEWMENYASAGEISPSTLTLYRGFFKNHIIPTFGGKRLAKITTKEMQNFKSKMLKEGKKVIKWVKGTDGKKKKHINFIGLSPQTVKHMLRLMRQMFEHAIDWNYLKINPATKVPHPKIPKKEMDFLTPNEVRLFLENVPQRWYAFFLTALVTGMRMGELLAMKWENIDWVSGQYFVKETWLRPREGRKAAFAVTKTESSIAPVDLTPTCLHALKVHRNAQAAEKLKAGECYQDQGLVFAISKGGALDDKHITQRTLIHQGESPKYIQTQLRHSSVEITFDRYGHLFPETNKEAALRLDVTLFGPGSSFRDSAI
jgi:integrase